MGLKCMANSNQGGEMPETGPGIFQKWSEGIQPNPLITAHVDHR